MGELTSVESWVGGLLGREQKCPLQLRQLPSGMPPLVLLSLAALLLFSGCQG